MMITHKELLEILHYNSETGIFIWLKKLSRNTIVGSRAGTNTLSGRRQIRINGKIYYEHRLAWLYIKGYWPENEIDHIDRIRNNNAFYNLREATSLQQKWNMQRNKRNLPKGVSFDNRVNKFYARIRIYGKQKNLGQFLTSYDAQLAYENAASKLHGDFYAK